MLQPFIIILMVIATGTLQLGSQTMLGRMTDVMGKSRAGHAVSRHWAYSIAAVVILMVGHMLQIAVWALCYYSWGDLGSMRSCLYFSMASFTTVGADDLDLQPVHRMAGAVEAGVGMLMFGWSTALLVDIIQRTSRLRRT